MPTARKLESISYDEMLDLAALGAGVLHSRSVELAKKYTIGESGFVNGILGSFVRDNGEK